MKPLKQYIENCIEYYIAESLFDDEDVLSDPKRDKIIVENWISQNYKISGQLEILHDDIYTVNCSGDVIVKNRDITSLTNGMFRWGEVGRSFHCAGCKNLKSLEGTPKEVGGSFHCTGCKNLKSLEGAPKEVGGDFYCSFCENLKSLEGAPAKINSYFSCIFCKNLKTLKGGPKYVKKDFYCSGCPDLVIMDLDYKKYNIRP